MTKFHWPVPYYPLVLMHHKGYSSLVIWSVCPSLFGSVC